VSRDTLYESVGRAFESPGAHHLIHLDRGTYPGAGRPIGMPPGVFIKPWRARSYSVRLFFARSVTTHTAASRPSRPKP